jgi:hypothetical protein
MDASEFLQHKKMGQEFVIGGCSEPEGQGVDILIKKNNPRISLLTVDLNLEVKVWMLLSFCNIKKWGRNSLLVVDLNPKVKV